MSFGLEDEGCSCRVRRAIQSEFSEVITGILLFYDIYYYYILRSCSESSPFTKLTPARLTTTKLTSTKLTSAKLTTTRLTTTKLTSTSDITTPCTTKRPCAVTCSIYCISQPSSQQQRWPKFSLLKPSSTVSYAHTSKAQKPCLLCSQWYKVSIILGNLRHWRAMLIEINLENRFNTVYTSSSPQRC